MPALPIVERELRVAARSRETYWSRSCVVLALGLLWIPPLYGLFGTTTEINNFVFNGMLCAAFGVSCFAFLFTADAVSRERREGTLGLLFLSRVRAGDVLLGKIGSSGFKGLCMLAAFLPMLMIPVLAGGVTGGEAFREGLVLLNAFWFSLCVGLLASTLFVRAFETIVCAVAIVAQVVFVPLIEMSSLHTLVRPIPTVNFEMFSPLTAIFYGREDFYKIAPSLFWASLAAVQLLAWLSLLLARLQLRGSLTDGGASAVQRLTPRAHARSTTPRKPRQIFSAGSPVSWLVLHQRGISATLWIACFIEVIYYMSSWGILRGIGSWNWPPIISWVIWLAASASTDALFARAGSKFFYDSKRSGQLETLLTTPLGPRGVMEGQWHALKKLVAWPIVVALTAMLLDEDFSLIMQIGQPGTYNLSWFTQCFVSWGIDISLSIFGVFAVCWIGMLLALKGKNVATTISLAALLGTGVPAVFKTLYAFGIERINLGAFGGFLSGSMTDWLEQIITTCYYLWLFRLARRCVLHELTGVASVPKKPARALRPAAGHHLAPQVTRATDVSV